jgi:hypothetical protein
MSSQDRGHTRITLSSIAEVMEAEIIEVLRQWDCINLACPEIRTLANQGRRVVQGLITVSKSRTAFNDLYLDPCEV